MKGYAPLTWTPVFSSLILSGITLFFCFLLTYKIPQKWGRFLAWFFVFGNVGFIHWFCFDEPSGIRMLAFCVVLFCAMKAVVLVEEQANNPQKLSFFHWVGFTFCWPGMRVSLFLKAKKEKLPGALSLVFSGLFRIVLGLTLIFLAWWSYQKTQSIVLATFLLLPGISLTVHFGLFNTVAGCWRFLGVDCLPLFRAPLYATSLSEFWGRRWNLAYSEMVQSSVYKPLAEKCNKTVALIASFFFSGLLHEVAISLPVNAGYGLPTLYFVTHGLLTWIERKLKAKKHPVDQYKWIGWIWTSFWLLAPILLLFHLPFLEGVVWPIIGIL